MKKHFFCLFLIALLLLPGGCAKKEKSPNLSELLADVDRIGDVTLDEMQNEQLVQSFLAAFPAAAEESRQFENKYIVSGSYAWNIGFFKDDELILKAFLEAGNPLGWVFGYTIQDETTRYCWDACETFENVANIELYTAPPEGVRALIAWFRQQGVDHPLVLKTLAE